MGNTQITAAKFKNRNNKLNEQNEQTNSRNSTPKRPKIVGIKNYFSSKASSSTTTGSKTSGPTTSSSKTSGSTTSKLESDEEDDDNLIPFAFQKNEEKFVYVKKKPPFKCPMEESCRTSKNGKSFREHLSRHFASNIKKDFPFFQENGKYICPIVDCEFLGKLCFAILYLIFMIMIKIFYLSIYIF